MEALLERHLHQIPADEKQCHQELPRLDSVPFESQHQYMATLHDRGADCSRVVYVKGSIEVVLSQCQSALDARGRAMGLDSTAIHIQLEEMASRGLRVLAFARGKCPPDQLRSDITTSPSSRSWVCKA